MKHTVLMLALGVLAGACATPDRAGVRNPEFFRQVAIKTTVDSNRPYEDLARCFEERATLLPMSQFTTDGPGRRTTYRLRGFGYTFEEIEFEASTTGSRAVVYMAPNLDENWRLDFSRDRGAPLSACAAQ